MFRENFSKFEKFVPDAGEGGGSASIASQHVVPRIERDAQI